MMIKERIIIITKLGFKRICLMILVIDILKERTITEIMTMKEMKTSKVMILCLMNLNLTIISRIRSSQLKILSHWIKGKFLIILLLMKMTNYMKEIKAKFLLISLKIL